VPNTLGAVNFRTNVIGMHIAGPVRYWVVGERLARPIANVMGIYKFLFIKNNRDTWVQIKFCHYCKKENHVIIANIVSVFTTRKKKDQGE
jgi:hypothetical protein